MAYGNLYYAEWGAIVKNGKKGYVYIDKKSYVGIASKLTMTANSFNISTVTNGPVIGNNLEFELFNDKTNFFDLLPLLTGFETEYRVRVVVTYPSAYTLFEGFINCESTTQKYLHRQTIKITASSYLNKLDVDHTPSIDILQNMTYINIIDEILRSTGASFPILVNSSLKAEGDIKSNTQTVFNKNGFFTEVFWDNETDRKSSLSILKSILTSFHSFLYWKNGKWYIERYREVWGSSISYVRYEAGQMYSPSSSGTSVTENKSTSELHSLEFIGQSQKITTIPGLQKIKVTLNDGEYISLAPIDLKNTVLQADKTHVPSIRTWEAHETGFSSQWLDLGQTKGAITNSITRVSSADPAIEQGLVTRFKITIASEDDTLNVDCKYRIDPVSYADVGKLANLKFTFAWWLRVLPELDFIEGPVENEDNEEQPTEWNLVREANALAGIQYIEDVTGSSFNKNDGTYDLSLSIPIGSVLTYVNGLFHGTLTGDQEFVLCIGSETFRYSDEYEEGDEIHPSWASYGDIRITYSGEKQDNVITGRINENYVNVEEVALDLYDAESYIYKNAILRGDDLTIRTKGWGTLTGANEIRERGVCYSTVNSNPTISDTKVISGSGFGVYDSYIGGLSQGTTYYVRAYAIDGDGTVHYGAANNFTTASLTIGSKYEGGIIGYLLQPGDPGYEAGNPHGIIVSPTNLSTKVAIGRIKGGGPYTSDANRYEIGDGALNTAGILANPVQSQYGIRLITEYNNRKVGGYEDWVLPSWGELKAIHPNKKVIGGFIDWYYWTSSEPVNGNLGTFASEWKYAHAIDFAKPNAPLSRGYSDGYWKKTHEFAMRAIRYF